MMMFWKTVIQQPVTESKEYQDLEQKLAFAVEQGKQLQAIVDKINADWRKAPVLIDFDLMRVFSIERMCEGDTPKTVIGYFINEPVTNAEGYTVAQRDVVHEWTLYISENRHAELIAQFKAWKEAQNG